MIKQQPKFKINENGNGDNQKKERGAVVIVELTTRTANTTTK